LLDTGPEVVSYSRTQKHNLNQVSNQHDQYQNNSQRVISPAPSTYVEAVSPPPALSLPTIQRPSPLTLNNKAIFASFATSKVKGYAPEDVGGAQTNSGASSPAAFIPYSNPVKRQASSKVKSYALPPLIQDGDEITSGSMVDNNNEVKTMGPPKVSPVPNFSHKLKSPQIRN
jgi:hypothetical protein